MVRGVDASDGETAVGALGTADAPGAEQPANSTTQRINTPEVVRMHLSLRDGRLRERWQPSAIFASAVGHRARAEIPAVPAARRVGDDAAAYDGRHASAEGEGMAQPPDGRRPLPWESPDAEPPAEAPTVSWGPPDEPATPADAAPPDTAAPTPDRDVVAEPLTPPDGPPPPAMPDEWASQNPLISWSPSGGSTPPTEGTPPAGPVWPSTPAADGTPPAVVGWTMPTDSRQASPVAGYVVAGTGSRLVGYLVDAVLLAIVNLIVITIADPRALDPQAPLASSISLPVLLGQAIVMGIEFAYFVGFWTSRGAATIGMRLVRIRVIDARADRPLMLVPAAARWLLLSGAIGIIGLLPIAPGISGLAALIWLIVLLVSVMSNPLRQGIHDQAAGSLVVQRVGVSSNAAVVGCLLLVALFILLPIISIIALIALGGPMEDILREIGQSI